jgi:hypothetical protein
MKKQVEKKSQKIAKKLPKSVKDQQKDLQEILPSAPDGTVLISCQIGETSITFPLPKIPYVNETLKKGKTKNRTIVEVGSWKFGVDIT